MPLDDLMLLRYVEDYLLPTEREMITRELATDLEAQRKVEMLRSTGGNAETYVWRSSISATSA